MMKTIIHNADVTQMDRIIQSIRMQLLQNTVKQQQKFKMKTITDIIENTSDAYMYVIHCSVFHYTT